MFVLNGYKWKTVDLILAIGIVGVLLYFGVNTIVKEGLSLASLAGSIWGFGTLAFILLYPLPIFGGSVEGEKLLNEKEKLSGEEVEIVMGRGFGSKISPKTIKVFLVFFFVSGVSALVGIFTNT